MIGTAKPHAPREMLPSMKLLASLLCVAAFAVVTPVSAQTDHTNDDLNSIGGIRRPTPSSSPGTTSSAKATGPLTVELAKDAKGKSTASTFGPNDTVYLVCTNVTAKKGGKLGVAWYGGKKERKISGSESAVPNDGVYNPSYNLAPAKGGSPAGTYRAEFLQDGKVVKNLKFEVK